MRDVDGIINFRGKEYKVIFNINVMEAIQEEYGSVEKWGSLCDPSNGEPNVKAFKYGIKEMINEGIDIQNEENGNDDPPLSLKQVGRLITELGQNNVMEVVNKTIIESSKRVEKNASSTKKKK